jgi:hypothetical protein
VLCQLFKPVRSTQCSSFKPAARTDDPLFSGKEGHLDTSYKQPEAKTKRLELRISRGVPTLQLLKLACQFQAYSFSTEESNTTENFRLSKKRIRDFYPNFCFLFDKSRKQHPIAANSIPLVYKCCTISMPNINQIRAFLNFLEIKIKVAGFDIPRL